MKKKRGKTAFPISEFLTLLSFTTNNELNVYNEKNSNANFTRPYLVATPNINNPANAICAERLRNISK